MSLAVLAAFAGVLDAAFIGYADGSFGATMELSAIAAAVLGGCHLTGGRISLLGTLFGAFMLRGIQSFLILLAVQLQWYTLRNLLKEALSQGGPRAQCCENDRFRSNTLPPSLPRRRCCATMLPFSFKWQLHIATTFHARVVEPTQLCKDLITAQVSTTWTRSNPTLPSPLHHQ